MTIKEIQLAGRIFLSFDIQLLSGLHIGGAATAMEIGGLDKPVIRNPLNNQPYIPGSSLKGKMRSLMEKARHAPQNFPINEANGVFMHLATSPEEYKDFPISKIFGSLPTVKPRTEGKTEFSIGTPTRLVVCDIALSEDSVKMFDPKRVATDLPYSEVKWEASIDRVTSAASPRQIERVPAGMVFGPAKLIYSVYVGNDEKAPEVASWFEHVIEALEHLEDDYLGGMGTRGNGRVKLINLKLTTRKIGNEGYGRETIIPLSEDIDSNTLEIHQIDRTKLAQRLAKHFADTDSQS
ncbi:type III-A CRISPR-associated RAMP protein Csm3 [Chloroflexia bacterium SDU3-3]|nr:type III-A CRISPR-associated RAMP protein Csm3 [Chloroflexia bacterium SDU3-3]